MPKILVTGAAGFIGSKVAEKLLEKNIGVIGIDNLNDYYDARLKRWRLECLKKNSHFQYYSCTVLYNSIWIFSNLFVDRELRKETEIKFFYFH